MSGNRVGGVKTARTNLNRDPLFYHKIGAIGGKATGMKGFATNRKLASFAGRAGGLASRRGKKRSPLNEKLYQEAIRRLSELKERAERERYQV